MNLFEKIKQAAKKSKYGSLSGLNKFLGYKNGTTGLNSKLKRYIKYISYILGLLGLEIELKHKCICSEKLTFDGKHCTNCTKKIINLKKRTYEKDEI